MSESFFTLLASRRWSKGYGERQLGEKESPDTWKCELSTSLVQVSTVNTGRMQEPR